jgi:gp16 family phage-associated protein
MTTKTKTRQQFREECAQTGTPLAEVAKAHGFNQTLFYAIVNDDDTNPVRKCLRGESHDIAVVIGIKSGTLHSTRAQDRRAA